MTAQQLGLDGISPEELSAAWWDSAWEQEAWLRAAGQPLAEATADHAESGLSTGLVAGEATSSVTSAARAVEGDRGSTLASGAGQITHMRLEALRETAPIMFLERPSARYTSMTLVQAQKRWGGVPMVKAAARSSMPIDIPLHLLTAFTTRKPLTDEAALGKLPWGDREHTDRPHLTAVQVQRYALLVTDVPTRPYAPSFKPETLDVSGPSGTSLGSAPSGSRYSHSRLGHTHRRQIGDVTHRQSVEARAKVPGVWQAVLNARNLLIPRYGEVAELLDELQDSAEAEDAREAEEGLQQLQADQEEEEAEEAEERCDMHPDELPEPVAMGADTSNRNRVSGSQQQVELQPQADLGAHPSQVVLRPLGSLNSSQRVRVTSNDGAPTPPHYAPLAKMLDLTTLPTAGPPRKNNARHLMRNATRRINGDANQAGANSAAAATAATATLAESGGAGVQGAQGGGGSSVQGGVAAPTGTNGSDTLVAPPSTGAAKVSTTAGQPPTLAGGGRSDNFGVTSLSSKGTPAQGEAEQSQPQDARAVSSKAALGKALDKAAPGVQGMDEYYRRPSGCDLWATAREAVWSGRVARLPSSPAYDQVSAIFTALFPTDFDRAVPILDYRKIQPMMHMWNIHMMKLETAMWQLEKQGKRPEMKTGFCGLCGDKVDTIEYLTDIVGKLQRDIVLERRKALAAEEGGTGAYFVLFKSQVAASLAANAKTALSENNNQFQVYPAPSPNDVNWKVLLTPHAARIKRWNIMLVPKILFVLFPVAAFSAMFMQLNWLFCPASLESDGGGVSPPPPPGASPVFEWTWYCDQDSFWAKVFMSLIVGWAPSWILSLYEDMVLPNAMHGLAQTTHIHVGLRHLDQDVCNLYFMWDVFNVFFCGMLGGSFVQQINYTIHSSGIEGFVQLLGAALPSSSNFFLNFLSYKAFAGNFLSMLLPNDGVFLYPLKRYLRGNHTISIREKVLTLATDRSPRYGPVIGKMFLVFVIGCAFAVVAPLVPAMALGYFILNPFVQKNQMMYVYMRKFEGGGYYFHFVFERLLGCLLIMVLFTCAVFASKQAHAQALTSVCTLPFVILYMGWYCRKRFGPMLGEKLPLEIAAHAPQARVNPELYINPCLHPQGLGWHQDLELVWGGIGIWGMN